MKQRLIAAAALLALGAAHAQTDVRLSGFVDLSLEFLKNSGSNDTQKRITSGGLNNSRFNISGVEDLGDGNRAVFTIEPMFYWRDALDPLHLRHLSEKNRARFGALAANPAAREAVRDARVPTMRIPRIGPSWPGSAWTALGEDHLSRDFAEGKRPHRGPVDLAARVAELEAALSHVELELARMGDDPQRPRIVDSRGARFRHR